LENNCTRKISEKSTYQIVVLKGFFSGGGSIVIAFIIGEQIPQIQYIFMAMLLGFVAYGLSILIYQGTVGFGGRQRQVPIMRLLRLLVHS